jgi:hypothetical protein
MDTGANPTPATASKTDAQLRDILFEIAENPDKLTDVSDEDIIALKKRINVIGTITPSTKSHAVISVLNMKDRYMRDFLTTAFVGFLYRRLAEYTPDYIAHMEDDYKRRINAITEGPTIQQDRDALREECLQIVNKHKNAHRTIVRDFLDSVLKFNPDKHVRRAPTELPISALDIIHGNIMVEPKVAAAAAAPSMAATLDIGKIEENIIAETTQILRDEIEKFKQPNPTVSTIAEIEAATITAAEIVYQTTRKIGCDLSQSVSVLTREIATTTDKQRINELQDERQFLISHNERIQDAAKLVGSYATSRTMMDIDNIMQIAPPADVFYHFGRYIDSHYESLHIMTQLLYDVTPDVDNSIIYYDSFDTPEKAREYIRVHEAEFTLDPKVIENGEVTIIAPFRENREKVDFYNRHTEALKIMMDQLKKDQELGKVLIEKRIKDVKRKNIHEEGPDDVAGLENYMGARGIVASLGKRPALTRAEREKLSQAEQTKVEYETPDNALAIRVLVPTVDETGTPVDLKQSFFYSESTNVAAGTGKDGVESEAPAAVKK